MDDAWGTGSRPLSEAVRCEGHKPLGVLSGAFPAKYQLMLLRGWPARFVLPSPPPRGVCSVGWSVDSGRRGAVFKHLSHTRVRRGPTRTDRPAGRSERGHACRLNSLHPLHPLRRAPPRPAPLGYARHAPPRHARTNQASFLYSRTPFPLDKIDPLSRALEPPPGPRSPGRAPQGGYPVRPAAPRTAVITCVTGGGGGNRITTSGPVADMLGQETCRTH